MSKHPTLTKVLNDLAISSTNIDSCHYILKSANLAKLAQLSWEDTIEEISAAIHNAFPEKIRAVTVIKAMREGYSNDTRMSKKQLSFAAKKINEE